MQTPAPHTAKALQQTPRSRAPGSSAMAAVAVELIKRRRMYAAYDGLMALTLDNSDAPMSVYFSKPALAANHYTAKLGGSLDAEGDYAQRAKKMQFFNWKLTRHISGLCESLALNSLEPGKYDSAVSNFYTAVGQDLHDLNSELPNSNIPAAAFLAQKEAVLQALRSSTINNEPEPGTSRTMLDTTYRNRIDPKAPAFFI